MALVLKGVVGQIKWSYYTAAAINNYTVSQSDGQWTLRATVVNHDAFKLKQKPLIFVAPHEKGDWRWPIEGYELQGGVLTAHLGAPLETNSHGAIAIRSA